MPHHNSRHTSYATTQFKSTKDPDLNPTKKNDLRECGWKIHHLLPSLGNQNSGGGGGGHTSTLSFWHDIQSEITRNDGCVIGEPAALL